MTKQLTETSKFLSYVLRHQPEAIGLTLDAEGWADVDALIAGATSAGRELDLALIQQIVSTNDKKRFTLSDDNSRIRAVQGHSTDSIAIQHIAKVPLHCSTTERRRGTLSRSRRKGCVRASDTMCTFPRKPPPPRPLASVTAVLSC